MYSILCPRCSFSGSLFESKIYWHQFLLFLLDGMLSVPGNPVDFRFVPPFPGNYQRKMLRTIKYQAAEMQILSNELER